QADALAGRDLVEHRARVGHPPRQRVEAQLRKSHGARHRMAFGRRLVSAPMALRILYVMDPMTRVLVDKDTTFAFQLEGQKRGHEQYHCLISDLFVDRAAPHATARRLTVERADTHFRLDEARIAPLAGFDVVFMRKDPPF